MSKVKVTRKEHGNAAYLAAWRAANPEKEKAYQAKYVAANREKHMAAVRKCNRDRRAVRQKWLTDFKLASGCVDCGYRAHPEALDFDHLPGHEKMFNLASRPGTRHMDAIVAEVAKCEVVCANCHRVRSAARRSNKRQGILPKA